MLPFILGGLYVLACLGVGYLGRGTLAGMTGSFLLSMIFTPLTVLIAMILFSRAFGRKHRSAT